MSAFNRTNLLILAIAVVGAAAGFFAGGWLRPAPPQYAAPHTLKVGDASTPVALPDLHGGTQSLQQWRGKLVLVNFWASWCGPCREEMPLLDRSQRRYADQGLQIVGVAADTPEATQAFLKDYPVAYPILIDDPARGGDVALDYGNLRGVLPFTVLIGRDGRILAQRAGNFSEATLDAWLAPHI